MDAEISSIPIEEETSPLAPPPPPARRSYRWLLWLPLAFALGGLASYFIFAYPLQGKLRASQAQVAALQQNGGGQQAAEIPKQVKRYDIPTDDDPSLGPAGAPIVIVEFSDYECPFCRKWYAETWPQIQAKYGDQVRLVYRDFPLYGLHANAEPAALAANCANDQGKYWDFHNALFTSQNPYSRETYESIAGQIGLDAGKFAACLDSDKYKAEVEADYKFAADLGVQSTPTFFVNGLVLVGAQPFSVFDQVIGLELKGEIPNN